MSQKREEIIKTTALLMRSKGYENTKLSDILEVGQFGKGQFYYYFSSKREVGLAVIDYFFDDFNSELLECILSSKKSPQVRFNEMLEYIIEDQKLKDAKCGCIFGNFAVEMSEHDEVFRKKISEVFKLWVIKLKIVFDEMIKFSEPKNSFETYKLAQGIVAMLEGGILIMKNNQDIEILKNVTELSKYLVSTFVGAHTRKETE